MDAPTLVVKYVDGRIGVTITDGITWAQTQLGKPYDSSAAGRFGPDGYDCSGYVSQILWHAGMPQGAYPTNSADMTRYLVAHPELRLTRDQARNTRGAIILLGGINGYGAAGHVGMSLGDGHTLESRGGTGTGTYRFTDITWDDFMLAPQVEYTDPLTPTTETDDMSLLIRGDKQPAVYRCRNDRTEKVWIRDESILTIDKTINGQLGQRQDVIVWAQAYVDTIPVTGPKPPGYTGV